MPEKLFIGRKRYLETFTQMLDAPDGGPFILNLYGPGGIGKTKILQKIEELCDERKMPHTSVIDLYGFEMSSRLSAVEMKIAGDLTETAESDPMKTYRAVRDAYKGKPPHERGIEYKQQFIKDLSSWAKRIADEGKKGVLIFDTFEEVRYTLVGIRMLNDWLPELQSAVVVISGRQNPDEIDFPDNIKDLVVPEKVNEFSTEEAIEYLEERGLWSAVQEEKIDDKLFDLSRKKPLLLALSADWMMEHDFFPTIDIGALVEGVDRKSFEKNLVQRLPMLAGEQPGIDIPPERLVLPAMAHIIEPLNEKMLKVLLPGFLEIRKVLKNLDETSFVKGFPVGNPLAYWFQDELRSLFHKHVFRDQDVEKEKWKQSRIDISKRMLSYYNDKINEAARRGDKIAVERAKASKLFHEIFIDPGKGMKKFQREFQAARENHQYGFSSLLLSAVRFNLNDLSEPQRYHFMLQEGRWLRDMGAVKRVQKRFEELLETNPKDPERTPYIYNALGATAMKMGQYQEALKYHEKSLALSKFHCINDRIPTEEQALGEVYLLMGNWEKSVEYFKKAHQSAMKNLNQIDDKEKRNALGGIADILANIGYAYGISGQSDVGKDYIEQAIGILENLNAPKRTAKARIIRWDILRRKGFKEGIVDGINKAIGEFEEIDHENRAEGYFYLGYAQWYQLITGDNRNFTDDERALLNKAAASFEQSIQLSRQFDIPKELPRALHELGSVYWLLGKQKEARQVNDEAFERALSSHDIYYAINALVKKAEFDLEDRNFSAVKLHAREMFEKFEKTGYNFPLFFGRMKRIIGDVAYEEKNYAKAFQEYGKGLLLIAQHGGYGDYTVDKELDRLESKINELKQNHQSSCCARLKNYWGSQGADNKFPRLMAFVDKHVTRLALKGITPATLDDYPADDPKGC